MRCMDDTEDGIDRCDSGLSLPSLGLEHPVERPAEQVLAHVCLQSVQARIARDERVDYYLGEEQETFLGIRESLLHLF